MMVFIKKFLLILGRFFIHAVAVAMANAPIIAGFILAESHSQWWRLLSYGWFIVIIILLIILGEREED